MASHRANNPLEMIPSVKVAEAGQLGPEDCCPTNAVSSLLGHTG